MSDSTTRPPTEATEEASLRELSNFARRLATRLVGAGADAEDVAQDALISTWTRWPASAALAAEGTRHWLAACVRNAANQLQRKRRARETREREASQPESQDAPPDAELLAIDRQRRLLDLVAELPPELRSALVERFLNGHSVQDAAARMGLPQETLRTRTRRGLALLRSRVREGHGGRDAAGLPCIAWLGLLAGQRTPPVIPPAPVAYALPMATTLFSMKKLAVALVLLAVPLTWHFVKPDALTSADTETAVLREESSTLAAPEAKTPDPASLDSSTTGSERKSIDVAQELPPPPTKALGTTLRFVALAGQGARILDPTGTLEPTGASKLETLAIAAGGLSLNEASLALLQEVARGQMPYVTVLLELNDQRAHMTTAAWAAVAGLKPGDTATVEALLLEPATVRVVDADSGVDLHEAKVFTDTGMDQGHFAPDPNRPVWVGSASTSAVGPSPLTVEPIAPSQRVWVTAEGYGYARAVLDHTGRSQEPRIVPITRCGSVAIAIEPAPEDTSDLWIRFYSDPAASSMDTELNLQLNAFKNKASDLAAGKPLVIRHVPKGTWTVRVEAGDRHFGAERLGSAQALVVEGEETAVTVVLDPDALGPQRVPVSGWVDLGDATPPKGLELRLQSLETTRGRADSFVIAKSETEPRASFSLMVAPGRSEAEIFPWGQTMVLDVPPEGLKDLVIQLQPPAEVHVRLSHAGTGEPVLAPWFGWVHAERIDRYGGSGSLRPAAPSKTEPGTFSFLASPGRISCHAALTGFRHVPLFVEVESPVTDVTLQLTPAASARLRLTDGAIAIQAASAGRWRATAENGDRSWPEASQKDGDPHITLYANDPGIYEVEIPTPEGFADIQPVRVEFRTDSPETIDVPLSPR